MTQFVDGLTVGIDLGTSSSGIATLAADGQPVVIPNSDGQMITPSVVVINDNGEVVIGPHGDWIRTVNPDRVIVGIKRQMGNPDYSKIIDGNPLNAEFFSALILMKLKQDAEARLGGPVTNAVITVPYYFNDPCRRATMNAGQIAGLNVIDLLNEPTAATLAYAWQKGDLGKLQSGVPEKEKQSLSTIWVGEHSTSRLCVTRLCNFEFSQRMVIHFSEVWIGPGALSTIFQNSFG